MLNLHAERPHLSIEDLGTRVLLRILVKEPKPVPNHADDLDRRSSAVQVPDSRARVVDSGNHEAGMDGFSVDTRVGGTEEAGFGDVVLRRMAGRAVRM